MDRERDAGDEREQWHTVLSAVKRAARRLPKPKRRPKFSDWLVVALFLWAAWHDRCLSWACDHSHYGALFRPRKLPSVSQFTRRIKTDRCRQILSWAHEELAEAHLASPVSYLDGKPLLVSPVSKDRDARRGRVSGGFAKGYKLHARGRRRTAESRCFVSPACTPASARWPRRCARCCRRWGRARWCWPTPTTTTATCTRR